jgi:hypothetical protein
MLKLLGAAIAFSLTALSASASAESGEDAAYPSASSGGSAGAEVTTRAVNSAPQRAGTDAESAHLLRKHWYGWQLLTTDLVATTLFLSDTLLDSMAVDNATLLRPGVPIVLSVGIFVAAPPAIHFAHGRIAAGLGSLGLRTGLPFLLGLLGKSSCSNRNTDGEYSDCPGALELGGVLIGVMAASAIDAAALSTEVPSSEPARPRLGLLPVLSADGKRGELRLLGTF